jgi:hypothetical protein
MQVVGGCPLHQKQSVRKYLSNPKKWLDDQEQGQVASVSGQITTIQFQAAVEVAEFE